MYSFICDLIKDEIEAINEYSEKIEKCEDQHLKDIFIKIRNDEKTHAINLITWMHNYIDAISF